MAVTIAIIISSKDGIFVQIRASTIGELKQRIKGYSDSAAIYEVMK